MKTKINLNLHTMKTILIVLVSVIMFASCSSQSGRRAAEPKAKAKILSSGNVVIVQDRRLDNLAAGDTVMIQQNGGVFSLSNFHYQRDTSVVLGKGETIEKFFFRAVISEKFPVAQSPRN